MALPLCKLLQKDVSFEFDEKCEEAFVKLKELLTIAPGPSWDNMWEKYPMQSIMLPGL